MAEKGNETSGVKWVPLPFRVPVSFLMNKLEVIVIAIVIPLKLCWEEQEMMYVKLSALCLEHTKCSVRSPLGSVVPPNPSSLPQGSCAIPYSPWRLQFLTMGLLAILLCDLTAFMIKVMTANVSWAPTTRQTLSKCFIFINSLNLCNYAMRKKYYYVQFRQEESDAQEHFILLPSCCH